MIIVCVLKLGKQRGSAHGCSLTNTEAQQAAVAPQELPTLLIPQTLNYSTSQPLNPSNFGSPQTVKLSTSEALNPSGPQTLNL